MVIIAPCKEVFYVSAHFANKVFLFLLQIIGRNLYIKLRE